MTKSTITMANDNFLLESYEGCHVRLMHSEPTNRWQAFKLSVYYGWLYRWPTIRLMWWLSHKWPVQYRHWTEDIGKIVEVDGTTITVEGDLPSTSVNVKMEI